MKRLFFLLLFLLIATPAWGTVNYDTAREDYIGNGSATAYVYSFRILVNTDIQVLVNGVAQSLGTAYTVSGVGGSSGGTVTFVTAPASGAIVTLLRNQGLSQLSNYTANESYSPTKVMNSLDRAAMIDQMLAERIARAPKVAASSTVTPSLCIGALKYIRWNAAATDLECVDGTTAAASEIAVANTGTWTNTQYNTPAQIVLNGADFSTLFSANQGGNFTTDGLTVAIKTPATATVYGSNAIAAYNQCLNADTNCVAAYLSAHADVASANVFGINPVLIAGDFAGIRLQNELDFNVMRTDTAVNGLTFKGGSTAEPTDSAAIVIDQIGIFAGHAWQQGIVFIENSYTGAGIVFADGASKDENEPAIQFGTIGTGNGKDSQYLNFIARDAGGTLRQGRIQVGADGAIFMRSGANAQPVALQDFNGGAGANVLLASSTAITFYDPAKLTFEADGQLLINATTALGNELVLAKQRTNGDVTMLLQRVTDSTPTGVFLRAVNAANNTTLFEVDVAGTVTRVGNTATTSGTKTIRASGGIGDCTMEFNGGILVGGSC